jgi:hypothetical protein
MDEREKNQIMLEFARFNSTTNESMSYINQSLSENQSSQMGNETSDLILNWLICWSRRWDT